MNGINSNTLSAVLDCLSKAIVLIDKNSNVIWFNNSFELIVSMYADHQILKKIKLEDGYQLSIFSIFKKMFPSAFDDTDIIDNNYKKNTLFNSNGFSTSLKATNGRTYNIKALPVFDENNFSSNTIITLLDLTEQIEFEMEYQRQHLITNGINRVSAAGLIVTIAKSGRIIKANPAAQKIFKLSEENLYNQQINTLLEFKPEQSDEDDSTSAVQEDIQLEYSKQEYSKQGFAIRPDKSHVRIKYSCRTVKIQDSSFQIHSILDINDVYTLLQKQKMDIKAAMTSQALLNTENAEVKNLGHGIRLTTSGFFRPCHLAGGDDYWFMHFEKQGKSLFVIRDHSGHDVACLIRAITTDIFNKKLIELKGPDLSAISSTLNNGLVKCGFLGQGQFITGMDIVLDHKNLTIDYTSYGHPSALLIRNSEISFFPDNNDNARGIPLGFLPDFEYSVQRIQLYPGDIIIAYTDGLTEFLKKNVVTRISDDEIKNYLTDFFHKKGHIKEPHLKDIQLKLTEFALKTAGLDFSPKSNPSYPDDITVSGFEIEDLRGQKACLEWKWEFKNYTTKEKLINCVINDFKESKALTILVNPEKDTEKIIFSIKKILSSALVSESSDMKNASCFKGLKADFRNNLIITLVSSADLTNAISDNFICDYEEAFLRSLDSKNKNNNLVDIIYNESDYFYVSTEPGLNLLNIVFFPGLNIPFYTHRDLMMSGINS